MYHGYWVTLIHSVLSGFLKPLHLPSTIRALCSWSPAFGRFEDLGLSLCVKLQGNIPPLAIIYKPMFFVVCGIHTLFFVFSAMYLNVLQMSCLEYPKCDNSNVFSWMAPNRRSSRLQLWDILVQVPMMDPLLQWLGPLLCLCNWV